MASVEKVSLSLAACDNLKAMVAKKDLLEQQILAYVQGLRDSLDLQGDGWAIDTKKMMFIKQPVNGKVAADVLGATASNSERE